MEKIRLNDEQLSTLAKVDSIKVRYDALKAQYEIARKEAYNSENIYNQKAQAIRYKEFKIEGTEDFDKREQLKEEIKKLKEDLEDFRIEIIRKQKRKEQFKIDIDECIKEVKEIPEAKEIIEKKVIEQYNGQIRNINDKIRKQENNSSDIEKIQTLINDKVTENAKEISAHFKNMLDYKNFMNKQEKKIKELTDKLNAARNNQNQNGARNNQNQNGARNNQAQIAQLEKEIDEETDKRDVARGNYNTEKTIFINLSKNADIEFEEAEVDNIVEMVNNGIERDKTRENDYDLEKSLNKQQGDISKDIKSFKEKISKYEQGKTLIKSGQERQAQQNQEPPKSKKEISRERKNALNERKKFLREEQNLRWYFPWHWKKIYKTGKQAKLELAAAREEQEQNNQTKVDDSKEHEEFIRQMKKSSIFKDITKSEFENTMNRVNDNNDRNREDEDSEPDR